jgi:hypothetical protein
MTFHLSPATPADASSIASVHLTAFDANPLLHVQFPGAASLQALHGFIVQNTLKALDDPGKAVWVVRDGEKIVGFASWEFPGADSSWGAGLEWPSGCSKEWLLAYYEKSREVRRRVVGERKCYGMEFLLLYLYLLLLCLVILQDGALILLLVARILPHLPPSLHESNMLTVLGSPKLRCNAPRLSGPGYWDDVDAVGYYESKSGRCSNLS